MAASGNDTSVGASFVFSWPPLPGGRTGVRSLPSLPKPPHHKHFIQQKSLPPQLHRTCTFLNGSLIILRVCHSFRRFIVSVGVQLLLGNSLLPIVAQIAKMAQNGDVDERDSSKDHFVHARLRANSTIMDHKKILVANRGEIPIRVSPAVSPQVLGPSNSTSF